MHLKSNNKSNSKSKSKKEDIYEIKDLSTSDLGIANKAPMYNKYGKQEEVLQTPLPSQISNQYQYQVAVAVAAASCS